MDPFPQGRHDPRDDQPTRRVGHEDGVVEAGGVLDHGGRGLVEGEGHEVRRAPAPPGQVHGHHGLVEQRHQPVPEPAGRAPAVDQDDGGAQGTSAPSASSTI